MSEGLLSFTPAGHTPNGWRYTRISELSRECDERAGSSHTIPVLSVTKYGGIVLASDYFKKSVHGRDTSNYKIVRSGQFAYSTIHLDEGSIGFLSEHEAGIVSPMYTVFEVAKGVEPAYLLAALKLRSSLAAYKALAHGSVNRRASISFERLGCLYLLHPPHAEQRKIAAMLSSVQATIDATMTVIEQSHLAGVAVLEELLLEAARGDAEEVRLHEVATVQTGVAKGKPVEGRTTVDVPYLRVANVQDGYLDLVEMKTLAVEPAALERYRLLVGDVLFTEGGDADKLGRGCVWNGEIDLCLHQNHVFAVRPDRTRLLPHFLAALGASRRGKSYFADCAKQTTNLASINSTQLKSFPVLLPSMEHQARIVGVMAAIADSRVKEHKALAALVTMKGALTSSLLLGEVRVDAPDERAA